MKSVYDMRMSSQSNIDKAGKPPTLPQAGGKKKLRKRL